MSEIPFWFVSGIFFVVVAIKLSWVLYESVVSSDRKTRIFVTTRQIQTIFMLSSAHVVNVGGFLRPLGADCFRMLQIATVASNEGSSVTWYHPPPSLSFSIDKMKRWRKAGVKTVRLKDKDRQISHGVHHHPVQPSYLMLRILIETLMRGGGQ